MRFIVSNYFHNRIYMYICILYINFRSLFDISIYMAIRQWFSRQRIYETSICILFFLLFSFFFFFFNKSQSFVLKRHTPRGKPAIVLFGCESERTKAVARMHKPGGPNQTLNPTLFFTVQSLLSANARPIFVLPKQRVRFPRGSGSDYIIAMARYNTREKLN